MGISQIPYGLVLVLSNKNYVEAMNKNFVFIASTWFLLDKTRTNPYDFTIFPHLYDTSTLDIQSQSGFMLTTTSKNHAWTFLTFSCDGQLYRVIRTDSRNWDALSLYIKDAKTRKQIINGCHIGPVRNHEGCNRTLAKSISGQYY